MRQKWLKIAEKKSHELNIIIVFHCLYIVFMVLGLNYLLSLILNSDSLLYKERVVELTFSIIVLTIFGCIKAIENLMQELYAYLEAKNYSNIVLYYELKNLSCIELKYAASPFSYSVYRSKMNKLPYSSRYKVLSYYYKLGKQNARNEVKKVFDANPYTLKPI